MPSQAYFAVRPGAEDHEDVTVDVLAQRALGRTGWGVTPLCVGTAELGDTAVYGQTVPEERALAIAERAFAGPLNFVDTSNGYGLSERRLGAVLRQRGGLPHGILLATKVDPEVGGAFDGRRARASARESLGRLGLEHLDLLYVHDPERLGYDHAMASDGPVATMQHLVTEGLVSHLGVAGGPVELLRRLVSTGIFDVVLTHNRWTLLDRSAEPLLDDCAEAGVAVVNAAPFGGGLLALGPGRSNRYAYRPATGDELRAVAAFQDVCARHEVPLAAAALQFSLREPRVTSTVVGMSRPERYDQALELAALPVADELWAELDKHLPSPGPTAP